MADVPGFEIEGVFYQFPQSFRLLDPVLVSDVTGMPWDEFADMLDNNDPRTLAGLVAVAVWQKNPKWKRERVVQFVQTVELDGLEFVGDDDSGDAAVPLADADTGSSPAPSTPLSADQVPSERILVSSGLPRSDTFAG